MNTHTKRTWRAKRPTSITIHPKAGTTYMNGYGDMAHARPFEIKIKGTRWKKLTQSLLITTPFTSHAVVTFNDGSFLQIEI